MIEKQIVIKDSVGFHARTASLFAKKAARFRGQVPVSGPGECRSTLGNNVSLTQFDMSVPRGAWCHRSFRGGLRPLPPSEVTSLTSRRVCAQWRVSSASTSVG